MNLYENAYRLFSMGYRDVSYISYKFIHRFVQKDQLYEMYENPLGVSYIQIVRTKAEKKEDRTMVKKPSMSATEAKKKAMANRGKFDVAANSDYGKPYHHLTMAAVKPYVKASADSVAIWGDTLLSCVPPAFAVRYRELQNSLDVAMVEEAHQEAAGIAASLVKALAVMDTTARAAGHLPPVIDGHLVRWGETTYCLLASGDIGQVRRAHPSLVVYHMSDVAALLSARSDSLQAVANAFPNARITRVGPMVEDVIDL